MATVPLLPPHSRHKPRRIQIIYCIFVGGHIRLPLCSVCIATANALPPGSLSRSFSFFQTSTNTPFYFMTPPSIEQSTREERRNFVLQAWECLHDCEACGKCRLLKGRDAETLYADYIEGIRSYRDITLDLRNNTLK